MEEAYVVSLLWPSLESKEKFGHSVNLTEQNIFDLGIDQIAQEICSNPHFLDETKQMLLHFCSDPAVIQYRLDIIEDFVINPALTSYFDDIIPVIHKLDSYNDGKFVAGADLFRKMAWHLQTLNVYVECLYKLNSIMKKFRYNIKSKGLRMLDDLIETTLKSAQFQSLAAELPLLNGKLQNMSSVTIGINLDSELRPVEAVFLSVESNPIKKRSILSKFLGLNSNEEGYMGISQFHSIAKKDTPTPFENALFDDLHGIFKGAFLPILATIRQYTSINTRLITSLERELCFYIGMAKYIEKLEALGIQMCKPMIAPIEQRICRIENLVDPILAMKMSERFHGRDAITSIVTNDIEFGPDGTVFILTGPNQGGKTTYTRSIGLAQVLFQAGCYIPGSKAHMSPVDRIFTHFSLEEKPNIEFGRLGEESKRLADIFEYATRYSLLLLNESLSSTSPGESLYLSIDIVKGIKLLGCRAVFATHLHELAASVDMINSEEEGDGKLISMVSCVKRSEDGKATRTYKVVPSPPQGRSFAEDIANQYGISLNQIRDTLRKRELIKDTLLGESSK
ncbi:MutS-related protein [Paenibacillus sp. GYB003]|uniref:MutS-related protein n=1 Tax=Paenibacillus sp. GYB003 TaxID=2994392 RepID=UPI002F96114F